MRLDPLSPIDAATRSVERGRAICGRAICVFVFGVVFVFGGSGGGLGIDSLRSALGQTPGSSSLGGQVPGNSASGNSASGNSSSGNASSVDSSSGASGSGVPAVGGETSGRSSNGGVRSGSVPSSGDRGTGGFPTAEMLRGDVGVAPDAYLFLDATQSRVIMPGLTWEEFDRLLRLDRGREDRSQTYALQSLEIRGAADVGRAEVDVTIRVAVDAITPPGQWTAIPLRMKTFRLLETPEVVDNDSGSVASGSVASGSGGVSQGGAPVASRMTVAPDGSGYVLLVRVSRPTRLSVRGRFAVRVDGENDRSINFDLPSVPTVIEFDVRGKAIEAAIDGISDEILSLGDPTGFAPGGSPGDADRSSPDEASESGSEGFDSRRGIRVDCGGGRFALRWGEQRQARDDRPLLDLNSRIVLDWTMPENQPVMSVNMTVKNLRGPLRSFDISLPPETILDNTPTHDSVETDVMVDGPFPAATGRGERLRVTIPDQIRLGEIAVQFSLRLEATGTSQSEPLRMRVPDVVDGSGVVEGSRQSGNLLVRTGEDYRLRWRSTAFVRKTVEAADSTPAASDTRFVFDSGGFELPLWLIANQRQLRLAIDNSLRFVGETAELTVVISPQGFVADNRLRIEANGWLIRSIVDVETREQLDVQPIDGASEVRLNARGGGDAAPIRVIAEKPVDPKARIELTLPQVIGASDSLIVQRSDLHVISDGRKTLVVDQGESVRLDRVTSGNSDADAGVLQTTFRVFPPDARPIVVGRLAEQQLRIEMLSAMRIALDGDQLRSTFDWDLASEFDLEGRLAVRFDGHSGLVHGNTVVEGLAELGNALGDDPSPVAETSVTETSRTADPWTTSWRVEVDGVGASLRRIDDTRYELVSDRLTRGNMTVRWTRSDRATGLLRQTADATLTPVRPVMEIPTPNPVDVDLVILEPPSLDLVGDERFDLVLDASTTATGFRSGAGGVSGADSASAGERDGEAATDWVPRGRLRLTTRRRAERSFDLAVRRALVRTVVGNATRFEQVIAAVQGGTAFRVAVPIDESEISIVASVDGREVAATYTDNVIEVVIPDSTRRHLVSLQVWMPESPGGLFRTVRPKVRLPRTIDRIFWRVVTPGDVHHWWSSATAGRAMSWVVDGWRLCRQPVESDASLVRWVAAGTPIQGGVSPRGRGINSADDSPRRREAAVLARLLPVIPAGNSYLFVGSDFLSFEVGVATRSLLWATVGSLVLLLACLLTYVGAFRRPLTVVACGILYAGLVAVAPDAAVLCGQVAVVAGVLVVVMMAIHSQIGNVTHGRVLTDTRRSDADVRGGHRGDSIDRGEAADSRQTDLPREQSPPPAPSSMRRRRATDRDDSNVTATRSLRDPVGDGSAASEDSPSAHRSHGNAAAARGDSTRTRVPADVASTAGVDDNSTTSDFYLTEAIGAPIEASDDSNHAASVPAPKPTNDSAVQRDAPEIAALENVAGSDVGETRPTRDGLDASDADRGEFGRGESATDPAVERRS